MKTTVRLSAVATAILATACSKNVRPYGTMNAAPSPYETCDAKTAALLFNSTAYRVSQRCPANGDATVAVRCERDGTRSQNMNVRTYLIVHSEREVSEARAQIAKDSSNTRVIFCQPI